MNNKDLPKTPANPSMQLTDAEWKAKLTPNQYYILREKGTERPYTGEFLLNKEKGTYKCAACGESLFTDDMKFDSHCGWPSFDREVAGGKIIQTEDDSHGMHRVEITCAKCGGHLGHLFDDGPTETGQRYCVNSGSLSFEPATSTATESMPTSETITLAGGCFWCMEAVFEDLKGVEKVLSGYSGGVTENPTYKEVCSGNTQHAEAVQITFNPQIISVEELLEVFFTLHDPTTLNRQGADVGTQYRSAIFYHNEKQKQIAINAIAALNSNKAYDKPIVTEVTAFTKFYTAENYHQEYYELNKEEPYCRAVIQPKIEKLHKVFSNKLANDDKQ
jgi:peptide methionine sulfoxide reductase msrA/msrB